MDWTPVLLAIIAALVPIATAYLAYLTTKNGKKTDALHILVNSRLTELLAAKGSEQKEIGRQEGTEAERVRADAAGTPSTITHADVNIERATVAIKKGAS